MIHKILVNKKHRYKALLISLMGFIFISPLLPQGVLGDILVAGLFFLVIFSASFNLSTRMISHWLLPLFGISALIFGGLAHHGFILAILNRVMMFLFFCTAIWVFGRDIFNKTEPHMDHIYGAIIIYFLIGISYAIAYLFLQLLNPQELLMSGGSPVTNPFDLYYFSFITLSTVGFGDVVAHGQFAKIVCMLESMTGLFYFAILVSSLIEIFQSSTKHFGS